MPPKRHTAFCTAGLALALGLAFLKIADLPCARWNCAPVIQSSYGAWWGVPVGVFAAVLWLGVFLPDSGGIRQACLAALGLGSLYFVGVQVFALKAFCPYCCAHAAASWGAWITSRKRPWRGGVIVAAGLAAAASAWAYTDSVREYADSLREPESIRAVRAALAAKPNDGLFWLGPRDLESPILVLSLTCPACLDLLSKLANGDIPDASTHPAIFFKTDSDNRAETDALVGAVLARTGDAKDNFLAILTVALRQRDVLSADPRRGAEVLQLLLPAGQEYRNEADALLQRQARDLSAAGIETTPVLIRPDGTASTALLSRARGTAGGATRP